MAFTAMDTLERVERMLNDTSNAIWDRTWLEEAMRQALLEYSHINPYEQITTLTLSSSTYELDVSSISDLVDVTEVWSPYTASNPEHPPNRVAFRFWRDNNIVFSIDRQFSNGDVARVFYHKLHTLKDLDAETTTTVDPMDEVLIAIGTAGHAATSRAIDLTEKVSVGQFAAQQVRAWGLSKLQEYRAGLNAVSRRLSLREPSRVTLPRLDRWDRDGGGWA